MVQGRERENAPARAFETLNTSPRRAGMGVSGPHEDELDVRRQQGVDTRGRAPHVAARLQGDDRGARAAQGSRRPAKRDGGRLGVRGARPFVRGRHERVAGGVKQHAPYGRIGRRRPGLRPGEVEGATCGGGEAVNIQRHPRDIGREPIVRHGLGCKIRRAGMARVYQSRMLRGPIPRRVAISGLDARQK